MKLLLPKSEINPILILESIKAQTTLPPFHPEVMNFVTLLSRRILSDKAYRAFPDLLAMAHWFRPARLEEMKSLFEQRFEDRIILPRGMALHFAPSNVDMIFIYSWFLSMILGNKNIIRLSSKISNVQLKLLDSINELFEQYSFHIVKDRTLIVTYEHDDFITEQLSAKCDVRLIWGGDQTVQTIRKIPIPPSATELTFRDRFSFCLINAERMITNTIEEIERVANAFYHDSTWFNQLACSSIKLVIWIGDQEAIKKASELFWDAFWKISVKAVRTNEVSSSINRLVTGYYLAANGATLSIPDVHHEKIFPYRIQIETISDTIKEWHSGEGIYYETCREKLMDIHDLITDKDQTMASYGFNKSELKEFLFESHVHGIDRIVPIGHSLQFDSTWDGYDLFVYLTREITIS